MEISKRSKLFHLISKIIKKNSNKNLKFCQVYFQPYFMLYGEVFADDIDPPCGEAPGQTACVTGMTKIFFFIKLR